MTIALIYEGEPREPELNRALTSNQVEFINFVLERYVAAGVEELDVGRLPDLIKLKYEALQDGVEALGWVDEARKAFIGFQKFLYQTGYNFRKS